MAFTTEQKNISNKLLSQVVYSIPRNQRKYVWNTINWNDLWNDVIFSIDVTPDPAIHFIGSIVLLNKGTNNSIPQFDIIDGQQRIITVLLFVASIMEIYKERNCDDLFEGLKQFLWTTDTRNQKFCKIQTEYQPSIQVIIDCVTDKDCDLITLNERTSLYEDKLVVKCFGFFCDKLRQLENSRIEKIKEGLLSTSYIDITATSTEDSYTIFEILNARGMILEDSELLKNFIMRYIQPRAVIDLVKSEWEANIDGVLKTSLNDFLIHYVRHKYKVQDTKTHPYAIIKLNNSADSVGVLFTDLQRKAKYYKRMISPALVDEGGDCTPVEQRVFKFLKKYRSDLFRPVLLSLMHAKEENKINNSVYEKALSYIQLFFTCYNLLSHETSNKISANVQKFAFQLENNFSIVILKEFVNYLNDRLPSRITFENTIGTLGWSNRHGFYNDQKSKRQVQIALTTLEFITSRSNHIEEFTIEHINPDSAGDNANIGNLLLLEKNLNNNCKDKPLSEKWQYYRQSHFQLVRNFIDRYENNPENFNVQARAKYMADAIYDKISQLYSELN